MAHEQQRDFCESVKEHLPSFFDGKLVVDIGSLDINGSNQYLFENSGYLGVDLFAGRNVDIACKGHELALPDESVDVVISTECFEHDSHYEKTIKNIYRMLKPGGLFIFSCATIGRPEHGTRRTTPEDAPFIQSLGEWADYYKNLEESDIRAVLDIDAAFDKYEFSTQSQTHDLYFWGVKNGKLTARSDYSFLVENGIAGKLRAELNHAVGESEVSKAEALSLKDSLHAAEDKAVDLSKRLEQMFNDTQLNKSELHRLQSELRQADIRANEFEYLYANVLKSISWKITKPVRFFGRIARLEWREAFSFVRRAQHYPKLKTFFSRITKVLRYLARGDVAGLIERVRHYRQEKVSKTAQERLINNSVLNVCVVTPRHTNFVAQLIADRLCFHGWNARVTNEIPAEFGDDLYVVLCPQIYKKLPPGEKRIVYQLEQSVSSRWFNIKYFEIIENSLGVLDYSLVNIEYLKSKGVAYPHVTYLPIGANNAYGINIPPSGSGAEVLFYGDSFSSPRRQKMLEALREHVSVDVVNNLFGDEMISRLKSAKLVINLHYYENALLEMPRIQECLSLGIPVVSESSKDQNEYPELNGAVIFFAEGSVEDMVSAVRSALGKIDFDIQNSVAQSSQKFEFMFDRFLVSMGFLPSSYVSQMTLPLPKNQTMFGLSMPETIGRRKLFLDVKPKECVVFDGIRRKPGWVGCGLSYAALARHAKANNMNTMTVMEDDVILPNDFESKLDSINRFLAAKAGGWDVFSGVIAALNPDAEVLAVEEFEGQRFVTINKMMSMVFNIYSESVMNTLVEWRPENENAETNTIDRFIESHNCMRVITTLPFLVGHREEVNSTLWGFNNSTYSDLIAKSALLLEQKVVEFLSKES